MKKVKFNHILVNGEIVESLEGLIPNPIDINFPTDDEEEDQELEYGITQDLRGGGEDLNFIDDEEGLALQTQAPSGQGDKGHA